MPDASKGAVLIYETDDSDFADSAIDALTRADIDCYRTGGALPGGSSVTVCLYIRNAGDFQRANQILLKQGAAVNSPIQFSPGLILICAIIAGLAVFTVVELMK